ncbi:hypothetical protein U9M48_008074 [Paspalum notatum var. saurae]|uniref:Protein FAR1-RELATED SEQUENCE n=1 Tax=Paspalum notatum var. saurae TaxID=547442 RepID=A0AAQ3SP19_PASNO
MTFTEKVMRNSKAEYACMDRKNDVARLLDQFNEWKSKNSEFYWDIQIDDNNIVRNIFWSHANFGDVMTFDTIHTTNENKMPLALFVGYNHQLQNVIFGQTLLRDESADLFEWLFKSF